MWMVYWPNQSRFAEELNKDVCAALYVIEMSPLLKQIKEYSTLTGVKLPNGKTIKVTYADDVTVFKKCWRIWVSIETF